MAPYVYVMSCLIDLAYSALLPWPWNEHQSVALLRGFGGVSGRIGLEKEPYTTPRPDYPGQASGEEKAEKHQAPDTQVSWNST